MVGAVDMPNSTGVFDGIQNPANATVASAVQRVVHGNDDADGLPVDAVADTEGLKPKRVREVCFTCWSRGQGAKCELHLPPGEKDRPVPPGKSALVCGNWDLAAIARKFRSEEIQEVRRIRQMPSCRCARAHSYAVPCVAT
jgi:hypothetical protein